jgi:hypothetical protein
MHRGNLGERIEEVRVQRQGLLKGRQGLSRLLLQAVGQPDMVVPGGLLRGDFCERSEGGDGLAGLALVQMRLA